MVNPVYWALKPISNSVREMRWHHADLFGSETSEAAPVVTRFELALNGIVLFVQPQGERLRDYVLLRKRPFAFQLAV